VNVDLSASDLALVAKAEAAVARYGDGKSHTTAAAARGDDGRIVTGLNVYHFTGGPCAELVVIGSAVSLGIRRLEAIAAVGDEGRGILNPCGRCRQILLDFYPDIRVIVSTGTVGTAVAITDLLPWWNKWDQESGSQPIGPES
jgi:cytidine deaminase